MDIEREQRKCFGLGGNVWFVNNHGDNNAILATAVTGTFGLTKAGPGTLIMGGTNSYI